MQRRHAPTVWNGACSHKIDYITIFYEILNLEGHQNRIKSSRVTAILLKKGKRKGWPRDRKTFQRASNAGSNFFLVRVKCVPNFTLSCRKSELCCNFAPFGVILRIFCLAFFYFWCQKRTFFNLLHNCCLCMCVAV